MIVFVKLILAHLMGDFILQPKSWVEEKEEHGIKSFKLYLHGFIHGMLVWLILWDFRYWIPALLIMVIHIGIDIAKLSFQKESNKTGWFLIDQLLHVLSIVILWYVFFNPGISVGEFAENPHFWIYLTAILFLTLVCGISFRYF